MLPTTIALIKMLEGIGLTLILIVGCTTHQLASFSLGDIEYLNGGGTVLNFRDLSYEYPLSKRQVCISKLTVKRRRQGIMSNRARKKIKELESKFVRLDGKALTEK